MKDDYRKADLDPPTERLMAKCVKLTREPWTMTRTDVDELRDVGWTDEAIHDAFQVVGYFNYINRVCDGLGVDLEAEMPPRPSL